ncbi:hypothetical protein, partial [Lactiplantibacillus pentosus]|uniref:hypothetical protein n=1 Tax=Lactiplantibacillus pentosus TaxID=1589 RepID=UPI001CDAEF17
RRKHPQQQVYANSHCFQRVSAGGLELRKHHDLIMIQDKLTNTMRVFACVNEKIQQTFKKDVS